MNRLSCLVALFVLTLAPALMGQRQDDLRQPGERHDFDGVVKSYNAARNELVVTTDQQKDVTIKLNRETRIMSGREAGTRAALTEGARVNGTFTAGNDGRKSTTAEIVRVLPATASTDRPQQPRPWLQPRDGNEDAGNDGPRQTRERQEFNGVIKSYNAARNELVVTTDQQKDITIKLNRETRISLDREDENRDALTEGARISGMFSAGEDGKQSTTAETIRVRPVNDGNDQTRQPYQRPWQRDGGDDVSNDGSRQTREQHDFDGVIKSFNAMRNELVVTTGQQKDVTITLARETRIMAGRETETRAALTEGARVNGTFTAGNDGKKTTTAEIIRVLPATAGTDWSQQQRQGTQPRDGNQGAAGTEWPQQQRQGIQPRDGNQGAEWPQQQRQGIQPRDGNQGADGTDRFQQRQGIQPRDGNQGADGIDRFQQRQGIQPRDGNDVSNHVSNNVPTEASEKYDFDGVIKSYNAARNELVVTTDQQKDVTIKLNRETSISVDREDEMRAALIVGARVSGTCTDGVDGTKTTTAETIRVRPVTDGTDWQQQQRQGMQPRDGNQGADWQQQQRQGIQPRDGNQGTDRFQQQRPGVQPRDGDDVSNDVSNNVTRERRDFNGVVKSYSAARNELVVTNDQQKDETIKLNRETRIMTRGETGTRAALTEGARVIGTFTASEDGQKSTTAETIHVLPATVGTDRPQQTRPGLRPRNDDDDDDGRDLRPHQPRQRPPSRNN